jgi:hypothetical protein
MEMSKIFDSHGHAVVIMTRQVENPADADTGSGIFSRFVTFLSRFYVRSLEYSYVFSDPNINFRSEVRSYP